jgi:hypothetical protein
MRILFVSVVGCLAVSFSNVQAQTPAGVDGRPLVGSQYRFMLSDIDANMVKEFNGAWQQCVLGTRDTEAVVLVLRDPNGSLRAVSAGRSNKAYAFTFTWDPAIIAVFHTHPNNRDPKPAGADILIARKYDVPMFTLSHRGMFMFDPATDGITRVKAGIDWLDASGWPQSSQLAAANPPQHKHP